jgi:flagellar basal-body rod protein FlgC
MQLSDMSVQDIVAFGLKYEKARVEAASYNIAMANVAVPNKQSASMAQVTTPASFLDVVRNNVALSKTQDIKTRTAYEPNHPLADSRGMVVYPQVDTATEMATLVSANRAYEANIRVFNSIKDMTAKAYEIGK